MTMLTKKQLINLSILKAYEDMGYSIYTNVFFKRLMENKPK